MNSADLTKMIRQLLEIGTLAQIEREIYYVAVWDYEKPTAVAEKLGVTPETVWNKIRRYEIPVEYFREEKLRQRKIFTPKV